MVAIVTGKGAGIENGSASVLGARGQLGSAATGRAGESVYVNAATGNLILSDMDEMLVGRGPDAAISRTYNSLGAWDGDNDDYWRAGVYRRVTGLTGGSGYGTTGSTVKRTDGDGSEVTYSWNANYYSTGVGAYVATDGGGAYDTLTKTSGVWTWTDGDTAITEAYDDANSGRITSRTDTSGNSISYTYTSGLITRVTTSGGDYTDLVYSGTQLTSLVSYSSYPTAQITRTFYEYDTSDRLVKALVNIAPADNSKTTGTNYETTYTYDGTSQRVASIAQSDGTLLTVGYTLVGSDYRVTSLTQTVATGVTRTIGFAYNTSTLVTTITDAAGQATFLTYDSNGNLTRIVTPPVGAESQPEVQEFVYDGDGNLTTARLGPGNTIDYTYSAHGARMSERDSAGNVVTRTYGSKNEVLTEKHFLTPDPDGAGSGTASGPLITRYVYDSLTRLRYVVSPETRITEYRYDGFGQQVSKIDYAAAVYSGTTLTDANALGLLDSWVSGTVDRSTAQRTDTWYDFRGNVSRTVTYAALDAYGEGTQDAAAIIGATGTTVAQQSTGLYRVTKTTGSGGWNADAQSTIKAEGDFTLIVKPNQNDQPLVAGVSTAPAANAGPNMSYGFYLDFGNIYYWEGGTNASLGASYAANDSLSITRVGSTISYYKGATLLRTVTGATGTLYFDSSVYTLGSSMDVSFTPQSIVNGANTSVTSASDGMTRITRTSGGGAWSADARGTAAATGDFALQVRPAQSNKYIAAGVSTAPASDSALSLNYGFYLAADGTLLYTEAGGSSSLGTTYAAGDNLWLVRTGSTLGYYKGATLERAMAAGALRTVTGVTSTLYFDSSFYDASGVVDVAFTPGPLSTPEISRTDYVYDPSGRLLSRAIAGQGVETYVYDGMGRITSATDMLGVTTSTAFNDSSGTTVVTLASGLVQTSTYDRAGDLLAYADSGSGVTTATTSYGYDNLGRLRVVTDPTGQNKYVYYDAIGRKVADIDADGSVTEYRYDANNNLTSTTAWANRLTTSQLAAVMGSAAVISNATATNASVLQQSSGLYRVTKTGGSTSSWSADAHSATAIDGDFTMQMVPMANTGAIVGISTSPSTGGITPISLGVLFDTNGVAYLYPPGNIGLATTGSGTYAAGDTYWMQRVGSSVSFYIGSTLSAAISAGAIRTVTGVTGSYYLDVTLQPASAAIDVGFAPTPVTFDAIRPTADTANDRWNWNVYDQANRLVETVDGAGSVTQMAYDGASQLTSTIAYANKLTTSQLAAVTSSAAVIGTATATNASVLQQSSGLYRVTKTGGSTSSWSADAHSASAIDGDFTMQMVPVANTGAIVGISTSPSTGGITPISLGVLFDTNGVAYLYPPGNTGLATTGSGTYAAGDTYWMQRVGSTVSFYIGSTLSAAIAAGAIRTVTGVTGTYYLDVTLQPASATIDVGFVRNGLVLPAPDTTNDRVNRLLYDNDGNVTGTLDAEGCLTETIYDAAGRKIRTVAYSDDVDPSVRASGSLSTLKSNLTASSANDIQHQWLYDSRGLLRATVDGEGTVTRFDYTPAGYVSQQVSGQKVTPTTTWTLATLPSPGSAILETTAWTYNLYGQKLTETVTLTGSATTTTSYSYDNMRRLISTTTQSGGADPRTSSQRYDRQGRLTSELSGAGNAALVALGGSPTQTQIDGVYTDYGWTYAYDTAGRLIAKTGPKGAAAAGPKTLYYYNADNALAYEVDAAGDVAEYRDDAFGERTDTIVYAARIGASTLSGMTGGLVTSGVATTMAALASSAVDSLSHVDFNVDGTVKQSTDPLSNTTTFAYNAFGELITEVDPLDGSATIQTTRTYDRRGLLKTEAVDSASGGKNIVTSYGYDAFGRAVTLTNALSKVTTSAYDRKGRLTSTTDALSHVTTYAYDARDNLVTVTDALSQVTRYVYDKANRRIATIDALGGLTTSTYDADGRVIATRAYKNAMSLSGLATEVAENNSALGTAIANTNAADQVTRFAYDGDGRLRFAVDALMHVVEHGYDNAGNAIRTTAYDGAIGTDGTGVYSASFIAGQITSLSLASAAGTRITRMVYDVTNRLTYTIDAIGQVTWMVHDTRGNLIKQVEFAATYSASGDPLFGTMDTWRGTNASTTYDRTTRAWYDRKGQLAFSVDALGFVTKTEYDKRGNVRKQTAYATASSADDSTALATLTSTYTQPTASSYPDARQTEFKYDSAGRLTDTLVYLDFATTPTTITTKLVLDALGQITSSTEDYGGADASVTTYAYDDVGRVTTMTAGYGTSEASTSYSFYDAIGQRTATVDGDKYLAVWTYDATGNALTETHYATAIATSFTTATAVATLQGYAAGSTIATSAAYDAFGRVTSSTDARGSVVSRTYDVLDEVLTETEQLETGTTDDRTTTYTYDSFGNAVKVHDARGNDSFAWFDRLGRVVRNADAEGNVTDTTYTRGGKIAKVTHQVGANLWPSPADGSGWTVTGAARASSGTINGSAASSITVSTSGTPGYFSAAAGTAVAIGDTITLSFWIKKGSVDFASFGLLAGTSDWGSNGDSAATIVSGPGTLTQVGGGLWTASGLDASQATLVTITRTFVSATTFAARIYAGSSTSSAASGNSVVVAAPLLDRTAVTKFTYDKRDQLISTFDATLFTETYILDAFGERTEFRNKLYNGTTVTRVTTYTYDKRGLMLTETLPADTLNSGGTAIAIVNTYAYDHRGNLKAKVEAYGAPEARTTTYTHDTLDRLTKTESDAVGVVNDDLTLRTGVIPTETVKYDHRGNVIETVSGGIKSGWTDPHSARTVTWYDGFGNKTDQVQLVDTISGVDKGTLAHWTYDANGNALTARTYGDLVTMPTLATDAVPSPVDSSNYRLTSYAYDRTDRLTTTTVASLLTGEWNGSAYALTTGNVVTTLVYDAAGNVVDQQDGRGNHVYTWYDKLGRTVAQVDAENYLTTWSRDGEGNVLTETRYADQIGSGETFTTATAVSTLVGYADDDSTHDRVTSFTYDLDGRRLTETRASVAYVAVDDSGAVTSGTTNSVVTYTYNGLGQVLTKVEANGDTTRYTYDVAGRLTLEEGQAFKDYLWTSGDPNATPRTVYTYNGLGDLKSTRVQAAATANDTNDRITTYTYGNGHRLMSMTDADGLVHTYSCDSAGRRVMESYTRVKSDGTSLIEGRVTRYDRLGRAITQTNAHIEGSIWVFTTGGSGTDYYDAARTRYDAYGEVTGRGVTGGSTGPDGTPAYQETFDYDAGGRLWRSNTGDGVLRFHIYDKAGNETLTLASTGADLSSLTSSNYTASITSTGDTSTTDAVSTISVYDKRGQVTATREPDRLLATGASTVTLTHAKTYNAFGEVLSETDARGYTTSFTYNAMGRMLSKVSPQVSITSETGSTSNVNPTETYGYDLSGRLDKVTDANGNVTRRTLLAGTGHDGSDALVTREIHADTGVFETKYDVFGDARILRNELYTGSNATDTDQVQTFDKLGQLVSVQHRGALLTNGYTYDILGQRTRTTQSWTESGSAMSATAYTDYDGQGRVVSQQAAGGDTTTTAYAWNASITALNAGSAAVASAGGWTSTTTYANGKTLIESKDTFDHVTARTDLGGGVTSFTYDFAGRMTGRSITGESSAYTWFNTGLSATAATTISSVTTTATSSYDAAGNKLTEYQTQGSTVLEDATVAYNALGWVTSWTDTVGSNSLSYEYDANGNLRRSYQNAGRDMWMRYDAMNRVVTDRGHMVSGTIGRTTDDGYGNQYTIDYTYNVAGQRMTAAHTITKNTYVDHETGMWFSADFNTIDSYDYTADGQVAHVYFYIDKYDRPSDAVIAGTTKLESTFTYDARGRQTRQVDGDGTTASYDRTTVFNAKGQVSGETVVQLQGSDTWTYVTTNQFGTGTSYALGAVTYSERSAVKGTVSQPTSSTTSTYEWHDGAVQSSVAYKADKTVSTTWTSSYANSASGMLLSVHIADGRTRDVTYTNNAYGQVIRRDEADGNTSAADPHETWWRFSGREMGYVTNNGTLQTDYASSVNSRTTAILTGAMRNGATTGVNYDDFSQPLDRINSYTQGSTLSSYTVQGGESLGAIAEQLWGDSALWYRLAEANGLSGNTPLIKGQTLTIPAGVTRNTHNAGTIRPYDPSKVIGDTSPTTPPPPKGESDCAFFGRFLMVAVAVAVTTVLTGPLGHVLGSQILGGALAGAAGSIASQAVGLATTAIDHFSFKDVAMSAIAGGVSGGLQQLGAAKDIGLAAKAGNKLASLATLIGKGAGPLGGALRGIVSSGLTQGIAYATRLQKKIDWAGIAGAGFSGGLSGAMSLRGPGAGVLNGIAGDIANAATRSVLTGTDFGDNMIAALPDIIGQTIGNGMGDAITARSQPLSLLDQDVLKDGLSGAKIPATLKRTKSSIITDRIIIGGGSTDINSGDAVGPILAPLPSLGRDLYPVSRMLGPGELSYPTLQGPSGQSENQGANPAAQGGNSSGPPIAKGYGEFKDAPATGNWGDTFADRYHMLSKDFIGWAKQDYSDKTGQEIYDSVIFHLDGNTLRLEREMIPNLRDALAGHRGELPHFEEALSKLTEYSDGIIKDASNKGKELLLYLGEKSARDVAMVNLPMNVAVTVADVYYGKAQPIDLMISLAGLKLQMVENAIQGVVRSALRSEEEATAGPRRAPGAADKALPAPRSKSIETTREGVQKSGSGVPVTARAAESVGGLKTLGPGWRVLAPAGEGAATGVLPKGYRTVSRWVGPDEAAAWMGERGTGIPTISGSNRMYVTELGAAKPGGTGPIRVDFAVPEGALQRAGKPEWFQIFQPTPSRPVYNIQIHVPEGTKVPGY